MDLVFWKKNAASRTSFFHVFFFAGKTVNGGHRFLHVSFRPFDDPFGLFKCCQKKGQKVGATERNERVFHASISRVLSVQATLIFPDNFRWWKYNPPKLLGVAHMMAFDLLRSPMALKIQTLMGIEAKNDFFSKLGKFQSQCWHDDWDFAVRKK